MMQAASATCADAFCDSFDDEIGNQMMLKTTLFAGLLGLGVAVMPSSETTPVQQPAESTATVPAPSQQATALPSPFRNQLHGVVKPSQIADLPSLVPGIISELHVTEGQHVAKGTPLITLDDRVPRARLAAAEVEANLTGGLQRAQIEQTMAESRLSRLQSAVSRGAGAEFEIEEAQGMLEQAKAAVQQQQDLLLSAEARRKLAEAELTQYVITAPFDGVITEVHIKSGAVDPSQSLLTIANLEMLEVEMHLPSRTFGRIQVGQSMPLRAGTPVSDVVRARVLSISPIINSASDTFRCLMQIPNTQIRLPAGFCVVVDHNHNGGRNATNGRGQSLR